MYRAFVPCNFPSKSSISLIIGLVNFANKKTPSIDDVRKNNEKYDLLLPTLNEDGWYLVFDDTKAAEDFEVKYIKVYQNSNYEQYIQDDFEFDGSVDLN